MTLLSLLAGIVAPSTVVLVTPKVRAVRPVATTVARGTTSCRKLVPVAQVVERCDLRRVVWENAGVFLKTAHRNRHR